LEIGKRDVEMKSSKDFAIAVIRSRRNSKTSTCYCL